MHKHYFIASTLLLGTIIGAGIFTLPQVFYTTGLAWVVVYLLVFGIVTAYVHLMYAEVLLRTKGEHELAGCTTLYLGSALGHIIKVTQVLGSAGTLIAYQILGGEFLRLVIPMLPPYSEILLFWIMGGVGIVFGVNTIAKGELFTNGFMFCIVVAMFILGLPYWDTLTWYKGVEHPLLPYGIVLYTLMGQQAVREVITYLQKKKIPVRPMPFVLASLGSVFFCLIFMFAVLLLYKGTMPPINVFSGLLRSVPVIGLLGGLLGLANILDSSWTIGTYFRSVLVNDLRMHKLLSLILVLSTPLVGYIVLHEKLLWLLGILGGIGIGFEALIILFIWRKARNMPEGRGRIPDFTLRVHPVLFWAFTLLLIGGLAYKLFHAYG